MALVPQEVPRSRVPAVARAAAVLELLASEGPLHLSELARRLSLPKSSLSNLCVAMIDVGWLQRIDAGFAIGSGLFRYGQTYFGALDPAREFQNACDAVPGGLKYTTQLAMLGADSAVIYIARRQGRRGVTVASDLGQPIPAHCTGAGKALLAALPPANLDRHLPAGPLATLTARSIRDVHHLREDLTSVQQRGFATDDEETLEGVYCIARALPPAERVEQQLAVSVTLLKAHLTGDEARVVHEQLDTVHRGLCLRLGRAWASAGVESGGPLEGP